MCVGQANVYVEFEFKTHKSLKVGTRTIPEVCDGRAKVAVLRHGCIEAALAAGDLDGVPDGLGAVAPLQVEEVNGACTKKEKRGEWTGVFDFRQKTRDR